MATRAKTTAITKWDEELAKQAAIAASMENSTATGQFFSLKSGQLSFNDAPLPNNEMAVIILDSVLETVYYEGEYDPDSPQSPVAFAFGRDEKTMRWHETSHPDYAGKLCIESEVCQWGSAERGRGKAARETRRLAMIPAGTLDDRGKFKEFPNPEHFQEAQIGYMKLPVTSVRGYAAFVKQVAGALKRPPFAIFTKVRVVPDANTQFKVVFEAISQVPDKLMPVIMARHNEAMESIEFPYQMDLDSGEQSKKRGAAAKSKGGRAAGKTAPAKGRVTRGRY